MWRKSPEVSGPETQFIDLAFEQNEYGNQEPKKCTKAETGKSYSFEINQDEYRRRRWYGNGNDKASGCRLE